MVIIYSTKFYISEQINYLLYEVLYVLGYNELGHNKLTVKTNKKMFFSGQVILLAIFIGDSK
jgi:hypothetical protein